MKNKFTYDALFAGEESVIPKQGEKVIIVGGKKMIGKNQKLRCVPLPFIIYLCYYCNKGEGV